MVIIYIIDDLANFVNGRVSKNPRKYGLILMFNIRDDLDLQTHRYLFTPLNFALHLFSYVYLHRYIHYKLIIM